MRVKESSAPAQVEPRAAGGLSAPRPPRVLPLSALRSLLLTLAILFASTFASGFEVACADEACASQDCEHEEERGPCDDCPPDCGAGCVCCVPVSALPSASAGIGVVLVTTRAIEYERRLERAPRSPEPAERDLVPRA